MSSLRCYLFCKNCSDSMVRKRQTLILIYVLLSSDKIVANLGI